MIRLDNLSIEEVDLSTRTKNTLLKAGFVDLLEFCNKSIYELQQIKGLGQKGVTEIESILRRITKKVIFVINNIEEIKRALGVDDICLTHKGKVEISYDVTNVEKPPIICINIAGKDLCFKKETRVINNFRNGYTRRIQYYVLQ